MASARRIEECRSWAVVGGGSFFCAVVVGVFVTIMTYGLFDWTEAYYFTASRRHLLAHLGFALSMAVTLTTLFGLPLLVSHRLRIHPAFSLVVAGALAGLAADSVLWRLLAAQRLHLAVFVSV